MAVAWQRPQHVEDVLRHRASRLEILDDFQRFFLARHRPGEEEVPEALDVGVLLPRRLRKRGHHLADRLAAEADAFHRIEVGDVGHQAADAAGAADRLADRDLADLHVPVLANEFLRAWTVLLDLAPQDVLECHSVLLSPGSGQRDRKC